MKYGLLGEKLSHSFSPEIHKALGIKEYELFELPKEELSAFMKARDFLGINVTIPYKQAVLPYLDEISEEAKKIGSVNSIVNRNGRLLGDNTDYKGMEFLLSANHIGLSGKKVLILGSGGTSLTAQALSKDLGAREVVVVSRNGENNYQNLLLHKDAEVIINTTPVGMYPHNGEAPVSLKLFPNCKAVLDVIYNPNKTALLLEAERLQIPHASGLLMLVAQAKFAEDFFFGKEKDNASIYQIYHDLMKKRQNLVLIGMPGSGKTVLGKRLAGLLGKSFADTDSFIEEKAGMRIPEIFARYGEAYFRRLETEAAEALGKKTGQVIATGGGIVLREENMRALLQNGTGIFIEREIGTLSTEGRPLSKSKEALYEMYRQRKPLYERYGSIRAVNNETEESCANQIISAWNAISCRAFHI